MKRYAIFLSVLIFCFIFSVFCADAVTVTLTQKYSADKYPQGGSPSDPSHYNTFSLGLSISGLASNKYYTIVVKLTSTNYTGYAANFGSTTSADLKFDADDNSDWDEKTADTLKYNWTTDSNKQSVPGTISVRCYDWGASGDVTVTIDGTTFTDTKSIPRDDNENGIADGWENVEALKVLLDNNKRGYNPTVDDEVAPNAQNQHPGDGWVLFDEYRGIFTSSSDTAVSRLNETRKDVMVCPDTTMAPRGTGSMPGINKHTLWTLEPAFVNNPFANVFENDKVLETGEDVGWVNFNSSGIPGFKRVWAIRIEDGGGDKNNPNRLGYTSSGSSSQYTLAVILTDNI